ncbi:unnamed protein product [Calicophoron daubneyi]|uniref:Uncharacterized protein n=1 Tax=Calicophoron daubneyi TaxID=300641 RepID=A0AAV2TXP7_CALDB
MTGDWFCRPLFAVLLLANIDVSQAGVASSVRYITQTPWSSGGFLFPSTFPQFQYLQGGLSQQDGQNTNRLAVQPISNVQTGLSAQQQPAAYQANNAQVPSGTPGSLLVGQASGQRTLVYPQGPSSSLVSAVPSSSAGGSAEVTPNSNTNAGSLITDSSVIGGQSDGIIGSDGQILGNLQDAAAVDSAGQYGSSLLRGQLSLPCLTESLSQYQPQQVVYSQPDFPVAYNYRLPGQRNTVALTIDQFGRPVLSQSATLPQSPLVGSVYRVSV